jgi:DNA-binding transcriptional LysR family regulator
LTRTSRATALTDAGTAALDHAEAILERVERLRNAATAAARRERGEVTVGFIASTMPALLAPLIQRVAAEHPELDLQVRQVRVNDVFAKVRDGSLDLAIARTLDAPPDVLQRTLTEEPVLAVVPVTHPLAARSTLTYTDFEGEPLVILDPRLWPARPRPFTPATTIPAAGHAAAVARVATGAGLYQLPASAAIPTAGVVYIPLEGASSRITLVRRPEPPSPALGAVIGCAERLAR